MKILHININYLGTTLHQEMVEGLTSLGITNAVFVPVAVGEKTKPVISPTKQVKVCKCFRYMDRLVFGIKQLKIFRALCKNENPAAYDLIHAYTLFTDGNVALTAKRKYGTKYMVAVRSTDLNYFYKYKPYLRFRGAKILKEADAIFFLSPAYQKQLFSKYVPAHLQDELKGKSYLIPNGIDPFWLRHKGAADLLPNRLDRITHKKLSVIFAGRINANKNVVHTAIALQRLTRMGFDISFTIVGRIEDRKVYDKMKDISFVRYVPAQPKEKLIQYYRDSDLFVMPSHNETFGLVYAEAMSQGLPVIYTRGQGFDGQFEEGKVGYAVSDKDPAEIADKILLCLKNYESLSTNALDLCDRFDWDRICRQYLKLYATIIETSSSK